jgi:hypothetical protein
MNPAEHKYQDACEKLAVAVAQRTAEEIKVARIIDSRDKFTTFKQYCDERHISSADQRKYDVYRRNVDLHIPSFVIDVSERFRGKKLQFADVEKESRDEKLKGDLLVEVGDDQRFSISLKNYKGSIRRAQVCSGTFLSFANNFVFEPAGIGTYVDPRVQDRTFRGTDTPARSDALEFLGLGELKDDFEECETINSDIRKKFIDGPEFEFLSDDKEKILDQARKTTGERGIAVALRILGGLPEGHVHRRILKMTGFDGAEDMLFFDSKERLDSLTHSGLRDFLRQIQSEDCETVWRKNKQAISFETRSAGKTLFTVAVPFTINKNGAWISDPNYGVNKYHPKEKLRLSYRQRRPKKSREFSTSTNTYLDLNKTSIFQ